MNRSAFAEFRDNVMPLRSDWGSLDVRVFAQQGPDGQWYARGLRAVLRAEPIDGVAQLAGPKVDGLWAAHVVLAPAEIDKLLNGIEEGRLELGGKILRVVERDDRPLSPTTFYQVHYGHDFGESHGSGTHIIGSQTYQGPSIGKWGDALDADLRSADVPWDGLRDVFQNFLGFPGSGGIGSDVSRFGTIAVEVRAPLGVDLRPGRVDMQGVELVFHVSPGVDLAAIRLGVFRHYGEVVKRERIPVGGPPSSIGEVRVLIPAEEGLDTVIATAAYRGFDAGRVTARVPSDRHPNPRVTAMRRVLGSVDGLEKMLDHRVRGRDLEPWLALLLTELGFSTVHSEDVGVTESVDILGFLPGTDAVFLFEVCESGPDTKEKLSKLFIRAQAFSQNPIQDVFPVLVTRLDGASIPWTDRQKAGREGIALVAREDIQLLRDLSRKNASPHDIMEFFEQRIPADPENQFIGRGRRRGLGAYL